MHRGADSLENKYAGPQSQYSGGLNCNEIYNLERCNGADSLENKYAGPQSQYSGGLNCNEIYNLERCNATTTKRAYK
ncbi:hypothetical protein QE152_g1148 [Popillia japonica]|uniref:Uncharacterized protein n=1 Tax=Popillia japonica TaxID=7064 RepID=A0AAW1N9I6_POPJA